MSTPHTPSPSPEPATEHPLPQKFKPGPILEFENVEIVSQNLRTQAQKDAASMLLGYVTVLLGTISLQHGAISTREKSSMVLQRLEKSFEENGVLQYSNPIVLLVEPEDLIGKQQLSDKLDGEIPSVKFKLPEDGSKPIVLCAAGQHREKVVLCHIKNLESELTAVKEGDESDPAAAEVLAIRIQGERVWAAAFYRKSIGDTRKFAWLGGLIVKEDWRNALTTLLKYPGLNKDALLKECGCWCTQPYSQLALVVLQTLISHIIALSSTMNVNITNTRYPELWDQELVTFLFDLWTAVNAQLLGCPSNKHEILVDEYRKDICQHLVNQWETTVVVEEGQTAPTFEDIEFQILELFGETDPPLLSWEGLLRIVLRTSLRTKVKTVSQQLSGLGCMTLMMIPSSRMFKAYQKGFHVLSPFGWVGRTGGLAVLLQHVHPVSLKGHQKGLCILAQPPRGPPYRQKTLSDLTVAQPLPQGCVLLPSETACTLFESWQKGLAASMLSERGFSMAKGVWLSFLALDMLPGMSD
ncbi:hypothetical protein M407DRAFT_12067 [Tulasnella calospora MUT 4182]|uniref:Uncharacterized protein n=1 Tax=Tulasnella calospora MUT 4182 TaxID=1051891 RepID=A0A0C3L989_9AGAM|nr:hypothetical protein M407DRAFT_12067 [Tulasnella calospora MUT 4182]